MTPEQRFQEVLEQTHQEGKSFQYFWETFYTQSVVEDGHAPDYPALIRTAWKAAGNTLPDSTLLAGLIQVTRKSAREEE